MQRLCSISLDLPSMPLLITVSWMLPAIFAIVWLDSSKERLSNDQKTGQHIMLRQFQLYLPQNRSLKPSCDTAWRSTEDNCVRREKTPQEHIFKPCHSRRLESSMLFLPAQVLVCMILFSCLFDLRLGFDMSSWVSNQPCFDLCYHDATFLSCVHYLNKWLHADISFWESGLSSLSRGQNLV